MKNKGAWWEKLGKPQYGGEIVIRANIDIENFDPYNATLGNIHSAWMERLFSDDWILDPAVFDYKAHWRPSQYLKGHLAESWKFTDQSTFVAHLRKGIYWQVTGQTDVREFVADDVVFHYNRFSGLGGFIKPSPFYSGIFKDLISVTASDKYTVVFKWKPSNTAFIMEALCGVDPIHCIENPEMVKKWGDLNDWHHANGTGPFILDNFIPSNSAILVKNHNYWGYDERYLQNKLPYVDTIKFLVVSEEVTAIEAMRNGKIDIIDHISPMQAYALKKTNPEIKLITHPDSNAASIEPRNDAASFNDIRVRKAMQMAINLPEISKVHYNGIVDPYPCSLTSRYLTGWGFTYEEWPQDLKDEYAYNPVAAKQLLADAGYPNGFKTNVVVEATTDVDLLKTVKSYFAEVGINMEIRPMKTTEWAAFVQVGHKHDQLAHCISGPLGHTSSPLHDLTRFQKGNWSNWAMIDDPKIDDMLTDAMEAQTVDEMKAVVRTANEYIVRKHFTISLLQPMAYSLCQPWVMGFNGQFGSAWAHSAGPAMLYFYLARFWVDAKLKKSMGY